MLVHISFGSQLITEAELYTYKRLDLFEKVVSLVNRLQNVTV